MSEEHVASEPDADVATMRARSTDAERRPLVAGRAATFEPSLRSNSLDIAIFAVWLVLVCIDAGLRMLVCAWRAPSRMVAAAKRCVPTSVMSLVAPRDKSAHVVVVGASFGGLAVQRELARRRDVRVTLIDFKEFFEYTPGVLRCYVEPSWLRQLTCALPSTDNTLVVGEVVSVSAEAVLVRDAAGDERSIGFDFLVLAVGSTYSRPIKPTTSEVSLVQRAASWRDAATKLEGAASAIIVGAGAVGVELAGEILTRYPQKRVTFVDMAPTILPGFDDYAVSYSRRWLEERGAELLLGEAIETIGAESVTLKSGRELRADVVYKCVGVQPNTGMLASSPFASAFGFRNSVVVDDHLQVDGYPRVFCVGDMMSHASKELKLGHTAEVNAHLAARNIVAALRGRALLTYPRGVTGADATPKIYCLSLGKYDAVMGFNSLVLSGWAVALMKWLLEWTKVAAAQQRPVGVLFWKVADFMSMLLGRSLLPTRGQHGEGSAADKKPR